MIRGFTFFLLAVILLLAAPAMAGPINLTGPGAGHVFEEESHEAVTENVSYNSTLLHHLYYHPPLEIPPWLWIFFIVGGILLLITSMMWDGRLQVAWLTAVLSLLFLFVALFTSFIIRDISFYSGWEYLVDGENLTAISTIQPVEVAWDWLIPFFFTLGIQIISILNFIVLTLEMAAPGLGFFRGNIFRRY